MDGYLKPTHPVRFRELTPNPFAPKHCSSWIWASPSSGERPLRYACQNASARPQRSSTNAQQLLLDLRAEFGVPRQEDQAELALREQPGSPQKGGEHTTESNRAHALSSSLTSATKDWGQALVVRRLGSDNPAGSQQLGKPRGLTVPRAFLHRPSQLSHGEGRAARASGLTP